MLRQFVTLADRLEEEGELVDVLEQPLRGRGGVWDAAAQVLVRPGARKGAELAASTDHGMSAARAAASGPRGGRPGTEAPRLEHVWLRHRGIAGSRDPACPRGQQDVPADTRARSQYIASIKTAWRPGVLRLFSTTRSGTPERA
jgi:hypothetical protein